MPDLNRLSAELIMRWHIKNDAPKSYYYDSNGRRQGSIRNWNPDWDFNLIITIIKKLETQGAEVIIHRTKTDIYLHPYWYVGKGKSRNENTLTAALKAVGWKEVG